ncbi:MAG TPA: LysR family transcriptional regulator [Burkholderiaceae bacterium]
MSISLRHMEVFRAVMTTGSVTRAATLLRTSQPTASRELAALERRLGLRLFVREHGRLMPTAEANILFDEVRRSYLGLERIVSVAQSLRQYELGHLSIACLPTFAQTVLPGACSTFLQTYPGAGLSIAPQESPLLEDSLATQRHDLGLVETDLAPQGTSAELLFAGDMVCVLPDGHPLLKKAVLAPPDFASEAFINLSAQDSYRAELDTIFEDAGVERRIAVETSSAASVCAMVRQGLGAAIVNPLTALDEARPGMQIRRFACSVPFQVVLIRPLHRPASSLVDAYCGTLRAHMKTLSATLAAALP